MPSDVDAGPALRRGGLVGPFFAIELSPEGVDWQSVSTLLDPYSGALRIAIGSTRAALAARVGADVEDRVAASLWLLGWSARLVSPWLGAALLGGVVPVVDPHQLLWRAGAGQPVPLAISSPRGRPVETLETAETAETAEAAETAETAQLLSAACVAALVEPLLEATAKAFPISRKVLWGNVASAVAGALAQLARATPAAGERITRVGRQLLAIDQLQGQGGWTRGQFARRTCCLMYRLPDTGLCADCVLVRRPE